MQGFLVILIFSLSQRLALHSITANPIPYQITKWLFLLSLAAIALCLVTVATDILFDTSYVQNIAAGYLFTAGIAGINISAILARFIRCKNCSESVLVVTPATDSFDDNEYQPWRRTCAKCGIKL